MEKLFSPPQPWIDVVWHIQPKVYRNETWLENPDVCLSPELAQLEIKVSQSLKTIPNFIIWKLQCNQIVRNHNHANYSYEIPQLIIHATYCGFTQLIAQPHNILCNYATYCAITYYCIITQPLFRLYYLASCSPRRYSQSSIYESEIYQKFFP
jgi:hypothetical protein